MKSRFVEFASPGVVRPGEEEVSPDNLGPHEVLVASEASLVSAGTELARLHALEHGVTFPFRPGYASVGRVLRRGSEVRDFEIGARVFFAGKHASLQRFVHSQDHQWGRLYPCPEDLPAEEAVFAGLAQIALTAPLVAEVDLNDTVAVFGLGLVGNLSAQLFQARGARVLALDPVEARCDLARLCGLPQVLGAPPEEQVSTVKQATDERGAQVTVDAVGHSAVVEKCIAATALLGQVVLLGTPRAPHATDATPTWHDVHERGLTVRGAHMWRFPATKIREVKRSVPANFEAVFSLIASGRLQVAPLRSHLAGPERAAEVYDGLKNRTGEYWGVVFDWRNG